MSQHWLSVLGIALDFAGFALLLREWWLAFFNEGRQLEMEEQLERARAMRNLRGNPFESLERAQDDQAIRKARGVHRAAMAARKRVFALSVVLIVAGFILQLVGAWPGCCPPWIAPQG